MTPAQSPSSTRRNMLSTLVPARRIASEKSTVMLVVVLSAMIMLPLKRDAPEPTNKKLSPPAPVKQRMRAVTFDGPLGMLVMTARLAPLAVQLVAGPGAVR